MTPSAAISLALKRCGLESTNSAYRSQMLIYLNASLSDIEGRATGGWWYRFKESHFHTTDGTKTYSLDADVLYPLSFRDSTNNSTLTMTTADEVDRLDPDHSEEGTQKLVYLAGVNGTTGYQTVGLHPTPGTTNDQIDYRYYGAQANLTNADDATSDFLTTYGIPLIVQPAIWLGAAKLFLQEEQDLEAAALQSQESERLLKQALAVNVRHRGNRVLRLGRTRISDSKTPVYQPEEGSLH